MKKKIFSAASIGLASMATLLAINTENVNAQTPVEPETTIEQQDEKKEKILDEELNSMKKEKKSTKTHVILFSC